MSRIALAALVTVFLSATALAEPEFSLDSPEDWQGALDNGFIGPLPLLPPSMEDMWGVPGDDFEFVPPTELYVYEPNDPGPSDAGLVMSWGDPAGDPNVPQASGWEFVWPKDPDLTGTTLHLTVMPPSGILAVSLSITDALGGWAAWDWSLPPLAPNVPFPVVLDPTLMGPQSGATNFAMAMTGFDPTQAVSIQAAELAVGPAGWAAFPPVPVTGGVNPWNYWSTLAVVPEPATLSLFVAATAMLLTRRRKSCPRFGSEAQPRTGRG